MKKKSFAIGLLATLLLLAFLFGGCKQALSSDVSELSEDLYLPVTQEPVAVLPEEVPPTDTLTEETPNEDPPSLGQEEQENILQEQEPMQEQTPQEQEEPNKEEAAAAEAPYTYVEPKSDLTPYLAVCAKSAVNVRKGAGTGYTPLFTLSAGNSLPYLWKEGEWLAVWTGERVGFVHGNYAFVTETNRTIEQVIRAGLKILGTPYLWGATRVLDGAGNLNPAFNGKNFDCSSFVQYCFYVGAGIKLGSYTGSQADYTVGKKIYDYADLKRGDFYFTGSGSISHVVIYLGGGKLLQTYSANGGPVSVTDDLRWKAKFLSGRRPDLTVTRQFG